MTMTTVVAAAAVRGGLIDCGDQAQNFLSRGAVEIARRFVGQQDARTIYQRARDGHALLFASGKFTGPVRQARGQSHALESFVDALRALGARHLGDAQGAARRFP